MLVKLIDFGFEKYPERAHYNDSGMDVFAMEDITLKACETKAVGLGFGMELPNGFSGFIMPKSGLSTSGIVSELSPIDAGYRGEIHAILTNNSNHEQTLEEGQKIGQLVIFPTTYISFTRELGEERESGRFGSTGV